MLLFLWMTLLTSLMQVICYGNVAAALHGLGKHDEALIIGYKMAKEAASDQNDTMRMMAALTIGEILASLPARASDGADFLKQAIELAMAHSHWEIELRASYLLGKLLYHLQELPQSLFYLLLALRVARGIAGQAQRASGMLYGSIATVLLALGRRDEALTCAQAAENVSILLKDGNLRERSSSLVAHICRLQGRLPPVSGSAMQSPGSSPRQVSTWL
jgi:tetratricopeptide (TPR) repeat protein